MQQQVHVHSNTAFPQAVPKLGRTGHTYLLIHPHEPSCGREDFMDWVKAGGLDTCRVPELRFLDKWVSGACQVLGLQAPVATPAGQLLSPLRSSYYLLATTFLGGPSTWLASCIDQTSIIMLPAWSLLLAGTRSGLTPRPWLAAPTPRPSAWPAPTSGGCPRFLRVSWLMLALRQQACKTFITTAAMNSQTVHLSHVDAVMAPHPPASGAPAAPPGVPSRFFRESLAATVGPSDATGVIPQAGSRQGRTSAELAVMTSDGAPRASNEHTSRGPSVDVDSALQQHGAQLLNDCLPNGLAILSSFNASPPTRNPHPCPQPRRAAST
jgi:hypothetical protein